VPDTWVAHRIVHHTAATCYRTGSQAILGQQGPKLPVLFGQALLVLRYVAEHLLEPEYLVFESFDVELFALAVSSVGGLVGVLVREFGGSSPLSLPV
jgi:hypothetical protein